MVPPSSAATLTFDAISGNADDYQSTNSNAVGSVLGNALSGLSASLASGLQVSLPGAQVPLGPVVSAFTAAPNPAIATVLSTLDQAVVPLLQVLGVQVGVSTIHDLSLTCGVSQVVY